MRGSFPRSLFGRACLPVAVVPGSVGGVAWWNGGVIEFDGRPVTADALLGLALYNYGHFTSMLVAHGRVRGLSLHLERLVHDCRLLFDTDLDPDQVRRLLRRVDEPSPQVVRVTILAPDLDLGRPGAELEPHVLVTTRPAPSGPAGSSGQLAPLRLRSAVHRRDLPTVKHVGLFETVRQRRLAQRAGSDDVLFVDERSRILEGATWNIGFHDGDRIIWPDADQLPGVTMELVSSLDGVPSTTAELDLAASSRLGVAFATNAAVGVRPISAIDEFRFDADAAVLRDLSDAYLALPGEEV
jgi:branched-subunit amino acid aminotransferase/4-amino-4-deoxychorismate lyase